MNREGKEVTGSVADNKVAIIFDWDNRWAIDDAWALANETKKFDEKGNFEC